MCLERKVVTVDMADTTPGPAGRRVVRGDLTVTKTPDPGDRPAPSVTLRVSSEYDVPVAVRIVEPLPDEVDPDRLCVPASATDNWSVADDGLAWSGHLPPGGESEAVYGVLPADADQARTFLGAPVVDAVHPAAAESDGGPTWRTAGAATSVRTMADVAAGESPAALAAAEATMRAAIAGPGASTGIGSDATARTDGDATDAQVAEATADVESATERPRGTPAEDAAAAGRPAAADRPRASADRRDSDPAVDHEADSGADSETDGAVDRESDRAADGDRGDSTDREDHLEVVFAPDATTTARERALREFARGADVTGCDPGIGRVASGRTDAVTLRVAGDAHGLADDLRERDAVRRVADVTPEAGPRPPAELVFADLKREYDPVPPAELERELAAVTADDGPMADEPVSLGDLLAEHADDADGTARRAVTDDAPGEGDAPDADASGRAHASDTEATDADASDPRGVGRDVPAAGRHAPAAGRDEAPAPAAGPAASGADGHLVAALVAAVDGASDDRVAALRAALDVPARASADDLAALADRVARLEDAVDSLTDEAGEARIDRSVLESDVGQLSRDVDDLRERVTAVEGSGGTADRLYGSRRVE